jgi:hypothetical protein
LYIYDSDGSLIKNENYKFLLLEKTEIKNKYDTITAPKSTSDYWLKTTLDSNDGIYFLNLRNRDLKPFKVIIYYKNRYIESGFIHHYNSNYLYKLKIEENKLKNISPLFYCNWNVYLTFLLGTLFVELLVGLLIYRIHKLKISKYKFILILLLINLITHPMLWYFYSHFPLNILFLELCVVIIELALLSLILKLTLTKSLIISAMLNFSSFVVGGFLKLYFMFSNIL